MKENVDLSKVYNVAYEQLTEIAEKVGLSEEEVNRYLDPDHILESYKELEFSGKNDIRFIMCRMVESLQNSGVMRNSIKFKENIREIRDILNGFDPQKVINSYGTWKDLIQRFNDKGIVGRRKDKSFPKNWEKFCKGIMGCEEKNAIGIAKHLGKHNTGAEYHVYVIGKGYNMLEEIVEDIFGMGETLASDFLKEIGYVEYGKPDVHIEAVYCAVNNLEINRPINNKQKTIQSFLIKVSEAVSKQYKRDVSVYNVDKVLWLVCADPRTRFYLHHDIVKSDKNHLLEKLQTINK